MRKALRRIIDIRAACVWRGEVEGSRLDHVRGANLEAQEVADALAFGAG